MNSVDSEGKTFDAGLPVSPPRNSRSAKLNDWQRFFLDRLDHLTRLERELADQPEVDADQRKLLSKAVYSTFLDCQSQGVGGDALQRIASQSATHPSTN
ncbi:MAG: hypothetical protein ACYDAG_02355 [Chloroflexota bacterium]